jgi:uncharacterized membrane protein YoaK (UPF0700 family)
MKARSILAGATLFSVLAGYVNLTMFEATKNTLSHMTGSISRLSEAMFRVQGLDISAWHFLIIIASFVLGAGFSGVILSGHILKPGRHYGLLMVLESAWLLIANFVFTKSPWFSVYLVSLAMGQQNAMASSYRGLVIRTTHMTGILTDLGFLLGAAVKRHSLDKWRLGFFLLILLGFFAGGWMGLVGYTSFGINSLRIPGAILFLGGVLYLWQIEESR